MTDLTSTNLQVRISSSGKDILSTGTVNVFDKKDLRFSFEDMTIIMEFIDDKGKQNIEGEAQSDKILKIKIFNFISSLGTGTTKPMKIGSISSRELYLSFVVYCLNEDSLKTVHYTFYLGEKVNE